MKFKLAFIFILFCHFKNTAQNVFFFDINVNNEVLQQLDTYQSPAEKEIDKYVFFENPNIELPKLETIKTIEDKRKENLKQAGSIRIYLHLNTSFDTLIILGFSNNYKALNQSLPFDSVKRYYMLSLISFETNLNSNQYQNLIEILTTLLKSHLKSDKLYDFENVRYHYLTHYKVLDPAFYLFTCPEVNIYYSPYDKSTILKNRREAHDFISNNNSFYISYNSFPSPKEILFTIRTKQVIDSTESINSNKQYIESLSNIKIEVNYEYIGLKYQSEDSTKVFWTNKDEVINYLNRWPSFYKAIDLFYFSAVREMFKPLN